MVTVMVILSQHQSGNSVKGSFFGTLNLISAGGSIIENQWWSTKIKPRWHNLDRGWVARKVVDATNKGHADVEVCWNGFTAMIELKYLAVAPTREDTRLTFSRYSKDEPNRRTIVSREQLRNLEEWANCGGNAFVFIGVEETGFLLYIENVDNDGMTLSELSKQARMVTGNFKDLIDIPEILGGK